MQKPQRQCIEQTTGITLSVDSQRGCKPITDDFGSNSNFDQQQFITAKMSLSKTTPKCESGNLHSKQKHTALNWLLCVIISGTTALIPPN